MVPMVHVGSAPAALAGSDVPKVKPAGSTSSRLTLVTLHRTAVGHGHGEDYGPALSGAPLSTVSLNHQISIILGDCTDGSIGGIDIGIGSR